MLIWTNHARERLGQRGLKKEMVLETFNKPEVDIAGNNPGTFELQRKYGNSTVTLIVKQNEKKNGSCYLAGLTLLCMEQMIITRRKSILLIKKLRFGEEYLLS